LGELSAEQREVDMCRAPGVAVVLPWVRPRLDRRKPVGPVISGQTPADSGEVRVDRRRMLVTFVQVSAAGVGLPDLYQLTADRPTISVQPPAGDDDPLSNRLTAVLDRQIGLNGVHIAMAEADRKSTRLNSSHTRKPYPL